MKEEIINFIYDNLFKNKINDIADRNAYGTNLNELTNSNSKMLLKDSNGKMNTFYSQNNRKMTPNNTGFKIKPIDKRSITPSLQILFQ